MQSNVLTVNVDTANTGTTTALSYTRHKEYADRTIYIADDHQVGAIDQLTFNRTEPKTTGNYKGVARSGFKLHIEEPVPGVDTTTTLVRPCVLEVSLSMPVGISAAKQLEYRQRLVALLDDDSIMDALMLKQSI